MFNHAPFLKCMKLKAQKSATLENEQNKLGVIVMTLRNNQDLFTTCQSLKNQPSIDLVGKLKKLEHSKV